MDHISIVIVHYNTDKDTRECLQSLAKIETRGFNYSVVVVDNASKKPLHLPQQVLNKNIEVLRSESNLGFTGGNNLGIKYAVEKYNSEFVLLLNSDTLVAPEFLSELYTCAKNSSKRGITVPKIYFAKNYEFHQDSYTATQKGNVLWFAGGTIDWTTLSAFHRGVDEVDRGQFNHSTDTDFATGCCMLIAREVLETIGGFDNRYFLYLEDVDLSMRARLNGFSVTFCPSSQVWHKNGGSSGGSGSILQQYYLVRNRVWFAFRYASWRIKLTTIRYAAQLLWSGNTIERRAMIDVLFGRLGKQPIL
ncbi:MAG TPA: glycosyltransferase family 2 protein [Vitreimonas sp.]|nr:glycosyltransferase family 2 protein [Vitreimonas sp.]